MDVVEMFEIPIISLVADITAGLPAVAQGDYTGGGLSLGATLPGIGLGFAAIKWVRKGGKLVRYADEAVDAGAGAARTSRGLWTLTKEGASAIKNHKVFGTIYKSSSDGLWWAADRAGHGGSKFKVFTETNKGLEWFKDADEFGNFIVNKNKSSTGRSIPWGQLSTVK